MSGMDRSSRSFDLGSAEGKGVAGCFVFIVLLGIAAFVAINAGPPYLAAKSFEADLKTEVSRAGARYWDNESIIKSVFAVARKNEVRIKADNVRIERYAGQVFVHVNYSVPIDLALYEYVMRVSFKASSYIGTL
ncbi:MAG: hypothetical protein FJW35_09585 [Acidobacteria bacterium]|nr:hypothetical protein [Acidobacteriota bacterium]